MTKLGIIVFDIDGVLRDVSKSYRRAIIDTVDYLTNNAYIPIMEDIDKLKSEGIWNNDWKVSQELTYRFFETQGKTRDEINLNYEEIIKFFQSRYFGKDKANFNGYIKTEPLLVNKNYFDLLDKNSFGWGFFSGATRNSVEYILKERIGLENPLMIAMEDAPEKPDPKGLFMVVNKIDSNHQIPVIYVGDTVADMYTVKKAHEEVDNSRLWIGVGILPPHVLEDKKRKENYTDTLKKAGASIVLDNVQKLTPTLIKELIK